MKNINYIQPKLAQAPKKIWMLRLVEGKVNRDRRNV